MREDLVFFPKHPSDSKTHQIETTPMPTLSQTAPFDVKDISAEFNTDLQNALTIYEDKRFEVTGIAINIGPDIHNKPSIQLSDTINGDCYALCIFPTDDHYSKVSVGDKVTIRSNYLVYCNWFGIVMKHSELLSVEKYND